ncbi:Complement component 1 Q subcomponent-binding protein, mitochondrial, partial [Cymbomonas tetramitiformis]
GAYNATAPNPVRMKALCSSLGEAVSRPAWFPVPAQALQVVLGEGATVVLEGQKVLPNAALDSGFEFKYTKIQEALKAITLG